MQEMKETQVQSLGWEDPLEEGRTTHSSVLAWRIPWTEEPGGLQSMGSQRVRHDLVTNNNKRESKQNLTSNSNYTRNQVFLLWGKVKQNNLTESITIIPEMQYFMFNLSNVITVF